MRHAYVNAIARREQPVIVRGKNFTFRSLHGDRSRNGPDGLPLSFVLDRIVTVTLPAVSGDKHREMATMAVIL